MEKETFFQEIEHVEVPWDERRIWVPVFYRDTLSMQVIFLASWQKLKTLLPSSRMYPIRVMPRQGLLAISAYAYKENDLGPYNEVAVSIPFTLDRPTPAFTGIIRKAPAETWLYIHQLPVITQIALDAGVKFAGYPKFLADVDFEEEGDWISCRLVDGEQHILTLSGRKLDMQAVPRSRRHAFTTRGGRLLRSELVMSACQAGISRNAGDARLELGDHPIAREITDLAPGRMLAYQYTPHVQAILTPVIESFSV